MEPIKQELNKLNQEADKLNEKLNPKKDGNLVKGIGTGLTAAGSAARILGMAIQKNNKDLGKGVELAGGLATAIGQGMSHNWVGMAMTIASMITSAIGWFETAE